jgi:hypothetical protein
MMNHPLVKLYEPINTLKLVHEDIWIVDGPIVGMAMYGLSIPFPTRMTVVRLQSGELWCHSPTQLTPELRLELDTLGPVRHLVSPNKIHYAFIAAWTRAYPNALAWASPGVRERATQQKIDVIFDRDLDNGPPPQWENEIDQFIFRGSRFMEEVVFFHCRSSTLILADLIENFEQDKVAKKLSWPLKLAGSCDPDGKAPLDLRLTFWGHKDEARLSLERMLSWNPETVILAHGRWYRNNGTAELRRAFRWLI